MPRTLPVGPALWVCLLLASSPAAGITIDFDDFAHGEIVADRVASHSVADGSYTLVVGNPNRPFDLAVAYDSDRRASERKHHPWDTLSPWKLWAWKHGEDEHSRFVNIGRDRDLERGDDGWSGGNIQDEFLGRLLIVQENDICGRIFCKKPDDERRRGGSLLFLFDETFQFAKFDLIDIEPGESKRGTVSFFNVLEGDVDNEVATFSFDEFLGLGQGVEFGDNTANRIDLGAIGDFNAVQFVLGGSGAIDNLMFTVPEPALAAMLALGLGGLVVAGNRRRGVRS